MNNFSRRSVATTAVMITTFALVLTMAGTAAAANDQAGADISATFDNTVYKPYSSGYTTSTADNHVESGETIQAAIDSEGADSVILVGSGYNSNDESFPITVDNENITIVSEAGPENTTIQCSSTTGSSVIKVENSDVTIRGFKIKYSVKYGISVENTSVTIENNILKRTNTLDWGTDNKAVRLLENFTSARIQNNLFENVGYAIRDDSPTRVSGILVEHNTVDNFSATAIDLRDNVFDSRIINNDVKMRDHSDKKWDTPWIVGIHAIDPETPGSENFVIENNYVSGLRAGYDGSGIGVNGIDTAIVKNNIVEGCSIGIDLINGSSNVQVLNNTITWIGPDEHTWKGLTMKQGTATNIAVGENVTIKYNQIEHTWVEGVEIAKENGRVLEVPTISYNNIVNTAQSPDFDISFANENENVTIDATYNWWGSENGPTHESNTYNVSGQGAKVSDNVKFTPWLDAPVPEGKLFAPVVNENTGENFPSIQSAIDDADTGAGDTISVREGTYEENLTIDVENLTLRSSGSTQDTILDVSEKSAPGINVTALDMTIEGFTIIGIPNDGSSVGSDTLYTMQGTSGADDLTIKNNIFDAPSGEIGREALYLPKDADNVTFINNEVNDYIQGVGARENIDNLLVKDSTFNMENLTVTKNRVGDSALENVVVGRAIQLWWGTGIEVIGNDFTGPGKFPEMAKNEGDLINVYAYSDFITYFEHQGTDVGEGIVTVKNNTIDNFYLGYGFFAKGGEVTNNTIENNLWGLQLGQESDWYADTGTTGLSISKNDIRNNKLGIFAQDIVADGLTVNYNNIVNNSKYGIKNIDSVTLDATYNWWDSTSGSGGAGLGTGDNVSENVVFSPWLENQVGTEPMTFAVDNIGSEPDAGYIQAGINGADSGDTVSLKSGTYEEQDIVIDMKNLTILSESGPDKTILDVDNNSKVGFELTKDNTTIAGFTVTGAENGFCLSSSDNNTLKNNLAENNDSGFYLYSSSNNVLENNLAENNGDGVLIEGKSTPVDNVRVLESSIRNNENGIRLLGSFDNIEISHNDIENNDSYGVVNENSRLTVNATYNWWDSTSGPGGAGPGTGDNVSENVDYRPWIEYVPPSVSIDSPSEGETVSSSDVTVQFSREDIGAGIDNYEFLVDSNSWEKVDDNTITSHEFTGLADGDHTLYVKAIDYSGNENTADVTVTIDTGGGGGGVTNDPPTADFSYSPSSPTTEDTVDFTDQSSDPDGSIASWSWDFGDGTASDSQNPSHTYDTVDNYTVTLTVTDDDGASDSTSETIEVSGPGLNDPPTADADGPYSVDEGSSVTLDGTGSSDPDGSIENYSWSIESDPTENASLSDSDTSSPAFHAPMVDTDTTVSVKLTVTDDNGATDTDTSTVAVEALLPAPSPAKIENMTPENAAENLSRLGPDSAARTLENVPPENTGSIINASVEQGITDNMARILNSMNPESSAAGRHSANTTSAATMTESMSRDNINRAARSVEAGAKENLSREAEIMNEVDTQTVSYIIIEIYNLPDTPEVAADLLGAVSLDKGTAAIQELIEMEEHEYVDGMFKNLSDERLNSIWNGLTQGQKDALKPNLSSEVKDRIEALKPEEGFPLMTVAVIIVIIIIAIAGIWYVQTQMGSSGQSTGL